jgi:ubiquinone/menaquinone biosynthesis C-methylase UbiE
MTSTVYEQSFAGVNATGELARQARREINSNPNYQRGPTYLHEWHPSLNGLPADVRVFCVGMDVAGFPKNLLKMFQRQGVAFAGLVVGLDFEPTRIRKLQHEFRDDRRFCFCTDDPETVRFVDGASELGCGNLVDRSFDVVICTYALHDRDVLDPGHAIVGLARVVKENGFCMVATHARSSFPEILRIYRQACRDLGLTRLAEAGFTHFDNFAQEDAREMLAKHFAEVEFDEVDTSLEFESVKSANALDDFMKYCDYFPFPLLASREVTDDKREELRTRFREIAAAHLHSSGTLKISKPSGVFLCRRPR